MNDQPLQTELRKLLREQQDAITEKADPRCIDRINGEVWELRNKYACGSAWRRDPAFDKWWIKQVAKARNLNAIKQILYCAAVATFFGWLLYNDWARREWEKTHPDTEETSSSEQVTPDETPFVFPPGYIGPKVEPKGEPISEMIGNRKYVWIQSDNPKIGWHWSPAP